jgi:SsrA-binding protein
VGVSVVATNRRARHDYFIGETFEAGLVLTGTEVKSLRQGRATIAEAYVSVAGGEAWLENAYIPEYTQGTWTNHAPRRKRKLLLHPREILALAEGARDKGTTIVPLRLYFVRGLAKVEIALGTGKKLYDKRQALRERQDAREAERAINARTER